MRSANTFVAVNGFSAARTSYFLRTPGVSARALARCCCCAILLLALPFAGRALEFALDDGAVNTFGGTPGGDLLALNQFHTGGQTVVIDQISVLWNPISRTVSPAVALYADPNGDGHPSDAVPLIVHHISVPANVVILNNSSLQHFPIPPTTVNGSFFVGAFLADRESSFDPVIGVDTSNPKPNRSWIIENTSGGLDLERPAATSTLVAPLNAFVNGNHMIRARYTVLPADAFAPSIVSQPQDQIRTVGSLTTLAVLANGTAPLTHTWFFNGAAIPGGSSGVLTFANTQPAHAGDYHVVIHNAYGAVTSSVARLTVSPLLPTTCAEIPADAVAWWRGETNTWDSVGLNDAYDEVISRPLNAGYTAGKVGSAFLFGPSSFLPPSRRTSNLVTVPPLPDLDIGAADGFTCEGWIRPSSISGLMTVFEWRDQQGNTGAGLSLSGSILEARLSSSNAAPAETVVVRSPIGSVLSSLWQHVALTVDRTGGWATLYLNGAIVARTNIGVLRPYTAAPFYIGWVGSASTVDTIGIDELTLYKRALSLPEIESIVAAGSLGKCAPPPPACVPPPPGIVAWWRGETNLLDSVDRNHGQAAGTVLYGTGIAGSAIIAGAVRVPATQPWLNVGAAVAGFTLEMWVRPGTEALLFGQPLTPFTNQIFGWMSGTTRGVSLLTVSTPRSPVTNTVTVWQFELVGTAGERHVIQSPAGLYSSIGWQHVAVTYDKAAGVAAFYFNGTAITVTNVGSFTPRTAGDLYLGPPSAASRTLGPGFDEVSLYSRALGAAEIRELMRSRNAGKCKEPPGIVAQPASLRVNVGEAASFTVSATGNPNLKYQWLRNGANLPGQTNALLNLLVVQDAHAGEYSVRITNAFGAIISSNALLRINHPPVADAWATVPLVISVNGSNATIVLDGSRSTDPDGDPLAYRWFLNSSGTALATGVVEVVTLPVGTHQVLLVVDDGLMASTDAIVIEIVTLSAAIERLQQRVNESAARPHPLVVSVVAAREAAERGNRIAAANQLAAFQNKIRAQLAPLDSELADWLVESADAIIALLRERSDTKARIQSIARDAGGAARIHLVTGNPNIFIIEASADLIHWERIGAATAGADGAVVFEDAACARFPARFYRTVAVTRD
jgi:hypothetical protein